MARERRQREKSEFDQKIIDLARVTRVVAGGKRMRFRACVAIGDRKGRIALATAKGADVTISINKAVAAAKKHLAKITLVHGDTIPHAAIVKLGAAKVLLKPAPEGSGVIAGGPVRAIMELAGVRNVVSKMLGSQNKINNAKATMIALRSMRTSSPATTKRVLQGPPAEPSV